MYSGVPIITPAPVIPFPETDLAMPKSVILALPSSRKINEQELSKSQTEISMHLTLVEGSRISDPSFLSPSRWNLIALLMREIVSLTVAPVATQPGRSGKNRFS
jgi:hypothetical protein